MLFIIIINCISFCFCSADTTTLYEGRTMELFLS